MTTQFIHELFLENQTGDIIEVMNCYDGRYGNIYYKGELIDSFYKQGYEEVLGSYSFVKELEESGIDIEKAQVLIYDLEFLRDYQSDMTQFEPECASDYSYDELRDAMTNDLQAIKDSIKTEKTRYKFFKFIEIKGLNEFLE